MANEPTVKEDQLLFCFFSIDKPDSLALRQQLRPQHKTYLANVAEQIAFAGPLLSDDGVTMQGSLLVIDFADCVEAQTWLDDEPDCSSRFLFAHFRICGRNARASRQSPEFFCNHMKTYST